MTWRSIWLPPAKLSFHMKSTYPMPASTGPDSPPHAPLVWRIKRGGIPGRILPVIGCLLLHPLPAAQHGDFEYADKGTTISITNYLGAGGAVDIPASIVGKPVTEIGDSAFLRTGITAVNIPSSVVRIGNRAFRVCSRLSKVTIPSSVASIGDEAFQYCGALSEMTIPSGVKSIGHSAFWECSSLSRLVIPSSVTSIGEEAFLQCYGLKEVRIQPGITSLPYSVFYYCTGLTSVTIPSSVTSIGEEAFAYCRNLAQVVIPSSVTSLGAAAFFECDSLKSVTIPASVTDLGDDVFASCGDLAKVVISPSISRIPFRAFRGCYSLASLTIPPSVKVIDTEAFSICAGLERITIPDSVTYIGESAFKNCESLRSITIPGSVTTIRDMAFAYCTPLAVASFQGNAPIKFGVQVFIGSSGKFRISYMAGTSGFTSPKWKGYPTVVMPAAPEIVVEQPLKSGLTDGETRRSFGTAKVGGSGVAKIFTIRNTGKSPLTGVVVSLAGKHATDFTATQPGRTSLAPGASTAFKVTFKPKAIGTRGAAIRISSNDKDENPFDVPLSGAGAK